MCKLKAQINYCVEKKYLQTAFHIIKTQESQNYQCKTIININYQGKTNPHIY